MRSPIPCPVRGHDHVLRTVSEHVQDGTGATAATVECPSGRYRWLKLDDRPLSNGTRRTRPRWGWGTK